MNDFINELNELENECISSWKNTDMIDAVKEFSRVLRERLKNCSIPNVGKRYSQEELDKAKNMAYSKGRTEGYWEGH